MCYLLIIIIILALLYKMPSSEFNNSFFIIKY